MKKIFNIIFITAIVVSANAVCMAAEEPAKEELISHMKGALDHDPSLLEAIPELKKTMIGEEFFYTYRGVKIDDLEKDKIKNLFQRIQAEAARIRAERLNKQLESIAQAQRAGMIAAQAARNSQPPAIPAPTPAQPQVPRPPAPPPQPTPRR